MGEAAGRGEVRAWQGFSGVVGLGSSRDEAWGRVGSRDEARGKGESTHRHAGECFLQDCPFFPPIVCYLCLTCLIRGIMSSQKCLI